ncbi:MAG TPA: extensin family protein [Hyphomicrobiaceae bacterium]
MAQTARVSALLKRSVVAVSTKLSIAVVLGLAAIPLLPHDAASRLGWPGTQTAPIELVAAKRVPLGETSDPTVQLAAARRRQTRERPEPREPEASAAHKNSAISPAAEPPANSAADPKSAPKQALTPPVSEPKADDKSEQAAAAPPKPEGWTDAEVIAALRECVRILAPIASDVELAEPTRHQQCGAPAPVFVKRIGSGASKIEINPPAELNCPMVVSLHAWVEGTLQPAAREALGTTIVRLRNASGYSCRARNGNPLGTDKLSEHALANAIDIAGFITADGRTVDVSRGWGLTERDKREAERVAAARAKDGKEEKPARAPEREAKPEPAKTPQINKKISLIAAKAEAQPPADKSAATKFREAKSGRKTAALERSKSTSDISSDPKAIPAPPSPERETAKKNAEAAFLRRLHKGACSVFGTVLGPEANDLHRDHFHFDLASRRRSALCQ